MKIGIIGAGLIGFIVARKSLKAIRIEKRFDTALMTDMHKNASKTADLN